MFNLSRKIRNKNVNQSANRIETDKSIPCIAVEREALSYTPLWAHSFRKFKRNGVPGIGLPRAVLISKPMLNIAIPELLSTHGKCTLNSGMSFIISRQQSNNCQTNGHLARYYHIKSNLLSPAVLCLCYEWKRLAASKWFHPETAAGQSGSNIASCRNAM